MDFENARFNMVEQQIRPWEVLDQTVLDLLFQIKREKFVSPSQQQLAFSDTELPLEHGQHMLQPKIEARLAQDAHIQPEDTILEIGTGSGYLTALLASLGKTVYSLDLNAEQQKRAEHALQNAGIHNVTLQCANGINGLPEHAPFDVIIVGGSLPTLPDALKMQLKIGGRLLAFIGEWPSMSCCRIERTGDTTWIQQKLYETRVEPLCQIEALKPSTFVF